jgi:DsbC/DsbD-like thiol-disulfide interchange protein
MGSTPVMKSGSSSRFRRRWLRSLALLGAVTLLCVTPVNADVIVARNTPHLSFTASLSPDVVKPGGRLTLIVDITPKKKMHVYAPGTNYRAIMLTLDRNSSLKLSKPDYPKPEIYIFKPLKEQVLVYSQPFKLRMNIEVGQVPRRAARLKITGTLSYQACDDRVCYLPESVPLEWNLPVAR